MTRDEIRAWVEMSFIYGLVAVWFCLAAAQWL